MSWRTPSILSIALILMIQSFSMASYGFSMDGENLDETQDEDSRLYDTPLTTSIWDSFKTLDSKEPLTLATMVPANKISLKKGMFEVQLGFAHGSTDIVTDRGTPINRQLFPKNDFIPYQIAYGLGAQTNIAVSGSINQTQETSEQFSLEGPTEPQITINQYFKNDRGALLVSAGYKPDMGPRKQTHYANSRIEGNSLAGGASYNFNGGFYVRHGVALLGGEVDYLFKDTRKMTKITVPLYDPSNPIHSNYVLNGGHEKSIRLLAELTFPIRFGMAVGRTWVDQEELQNITDYTPTLHEGFGKSFVQGWSRFQFNRHLSLIPEMSYSLYDTVATDSGLRDQEFIVKLNVRYRF